MPLDPIVLLNLRILGGMVVLLWALELIDTIVLQGRLHRLGIRPRQTAGLKGILLSPLLHSDLKHLAANTLPLVVLGGLILFRSQPTFAIVTAVVWLISGIGTWLFGGPRTNHIGASGIVFGYLGFLLLQGYLERSPIALGLAVVAGVLYGGSLWGVLPIKRGRSWQGHLFGFIGGGVAARYLPELNQYFAMAIAQL
ncbi:MAG: rhomboid family intramembrane serine protease [Alkalinema sp. RL_2_19]|nr:rhomboid family intramembrane serine protease [Alkalinema sp. RL_2_19]